MKTQRRRFTAGLGALFFGDDDVRPTAIDGRPADLENWGGGSLDDHHTFIVRYRPDEDRHLDLHVDECGDLSVICLKVSACCNIV